MHYCPPPQFDFNDLYHLHSLPFPPIAGEYSLFFFSSCKEEGNGAGLFALWFCHVLVFN